MDPASFLYRAVAEAKESNHIWPEYAACEAALETGWGTSLLCISANNLFGQKQGPQTAGLPTVTLATKEVINGQWQPTVATWPKFASWADSFSARMELLRALAPDPKFLDYKLALEAPTGTGFIYSVSKTWSTDPQRAQKVLMIFDNHIGEKGVIH